MQFKFLLSLAALGLAATTPAAAQRRQPTPEQRIERLEKQVRQVQKQVFPKGQPADTAGFVDDPAATQASVTALIGRLDSAERQMAELVRSSEENGNRIAVMEADLARLRAEQDRRLRSLETNAATAGAASEAADAPAETSDPVPPPSKPKVESDRETATGASATADPAETAYDKGFRQWSAGQYDQAIATLNAMAKAYPTHRRVSWAHNLAGRAMLDKGQPRAAAEALLANYRRDPKGERAQDSLFYLGQALVKLGQPGQACKAYAELEDVYGDKIRPQIRSSLTGAKSGAKCS